MPTGRISAAADSLEHADAATLPTPAHAGHLVRLVPDAPCSSAEVPVAFSGSRNATARDLIAAETGGVRDLVELGLLQVDLRLQDGIVLLRTAAGEDGEQDGEDEAQSVPELGATRHGALQFTARCGLYWASSYEAAAGATSLDESLRQKEEGQGGRMLTSDYRFRQPSIL